MKAMAIALLGALEAEVEPLRRAANAVEVERRLEQPIYRGQIGEREVLIAELGIGKVRAAALLQALIEHHRFSAAICFGSAGAINPALNVGDIVIARRVTQHDYVLITKPSILGGRGEWIKTDERLSAGLLAAGRRLGHRAQAGSIITGDAVVVTHEARRRLWETFHAECVEMEGAAVGLVCALNHIPFAVMRGLTDNADEHAISSFKQRIRDVSESVAQIVVEYIRHKEP